MRPSLPTLISAVVFVGTFAVGSTAFAQEHFDGQEVSGAVSEHSDISGSARSMTEDWLIAPENTGTLGGKFSFLTASGDLSNMVGTENLKFTDVVMLRLDGRYSIAGVAEIFAGSSLLPKQPSTTNESVFQNATFGTRIGLADHLATSLTFDGGSTLQQSGFWSSAALTVDGRYSIDRYVTFDGAVGGSGTGLFLDEDLTPWFAEVLANAKIVLKTPGISAFWIGTTFSFPVASSDYDPDTQGSIDPQTRANFHVGGVLSFVDDWDIYATFAFIDRGDIEERQTTIPVLDGGFDQQQLTFGVTRRFGYN